MACQMVDFLEIRRLGKSYLGTRLNQLTTGSSRQNQMFGASESHFGKCGAGLLLLMEICLVVR